MRYATSLGIETRRRGPDGKQNLWRRTEEVKRDCAERLQSLAGSPYRAQSLAGPPEFAAVGEGGVVSSGQEQAAAEGATPADDEPRQARTLPSLHSYFSGMGKSELRREAAKLHLRKHGAQTTAQLREACQRAVSSQGTLDRYARGSGMEPAATSHIEPAATSPTPVSGSAAARAPERKLPVRPRARDYKAGSRIQKSGTAHSRMPKRAQKRGSRTRRGRRRGRRGSRTRRGRRGSRTRRGRL